MADDEQPKKPGPPPAVPGESYDAEQWQRFQRFQEFQKFEQAQRHGQPPPTDQPPPPRGRTGKPLWRKLVVNRWMRRLVVALVLVLAASWTLDHLFGNPDEDLPASETGGDKTTRTVLFAESPREAIRMIYNNVAQATLPDACTRFETEDLADRFGDHFNAPDCPSAILRLHAEVGRASDYARPIFPAGVNLVPDADGEVVVSSCALDIREGPRLGQFTLKVIPGSRSDQWIITDHQTEDVDCR